MRKHYRMAALATAVAVVAMGGAVGNASAAEQYFSATLRSGEEAPMTLETAGTGVFGALLDANETSLQFLLNYSSLEGGEAGTVAAAHIHIGRPGLAGGIVVHFCGTGGTAACPPSPGSVSGVITSANVVAVPAQGVAAGDFGKLVDALRRGDAYVNVHNATYPTGEIRGQIK